MSLYAHIYFSLLLFALAFLGLAFSAFGQNAENLNQPVVAPFVVDNTPAQTHIRQLQNFRQLHAEPENNARSASSHLTTDVHKP